MVQVGRIVGAVEADVAGVNHKVGATASDVGHDRAPMLVGVRCRRRQVGVSDDEQLRHGPSEPGTGYAISTAFNGRA